MPTWLRLFSNGYTDEAGDPALDPDDESLIVSILSAGTFIGALCAAPAADYLGRRMGLMLSTAIVFVLGVILQTISTDQPLFIAGRFFAGLGVGLISAMIPLYQSETAPKWIRGTIVGTYQLAITVGLFLASIVNNGTKDMETTASYRIPVALQFAWAIILVGGLLFLPETPRFCIKQGKFDRAAQALSRLRRLPVDHPSLVEELAEVRANHEYEMSIGKGTYMDCFKGTVGKRLFTGYALQALQQLSGVNFIFYYGTAYFTRAGFQNPFIIQVITNSVNVVSIPLLPLFSRPHTLTYLSKASTFPGLYLVEKLGRRNLLLLGAIGMCVCQFIVAITGTVAGTSDLAAQRAAIAFVCIYIYFFASSWGPVAWVVTGEMFPLKVRAKALSMTTATNWLLNFAIAYSTPYLVDGDHANLQSKVFFIWGGCCLIGIVFVWAFIYETKGLTLEQVDELYGLVDKAWKSKDFRPQVSYRESVADGGATKGMSMRQMSVAQEERRRSSVGGEKL